MAADHTLHRFDGDDGVRSTSSRPAANHPDADTDRYAHLSSTH